MSLSLMNSLRVEWVTSSSFTMRALPRKSASFGRRSSEMAMWLAACTAWRSCGAVKIPHLLTRRARITIGTATQYTRINDSLGQGDQPRPHRRAPPQHARHGVEHPAGPDDTAGPLARANRGGHTHPARGRGGRGG
jgi:hypothetical protein